MPMSTYAHGFNNRVSIKNFPIDIAIPATAKVYWVDSTYGSDNYLGTEKQPFATIDYAVGRCTADRGDYILVAPAHIETVSAAGGLTCDVAGVTIVFLGDGSEKATISLDTVVTASVVVSAANVSLINPRFVAAIDALTGALSITGINCYIENAEYNDATDIDTTDCLVAIATATGLIINGWRYIPGNEGGTQKQSHIQLNGVDNAILTNIDVVGDFATGNIENVTDEILNARLENIKLKNTNATPKPGIVLDADATGQAKNLDVRIVSGTTYVSSVAKLNWDNSSLGYNTDGGAGDPIGTGAAIGVEGKIDSIQDDMGDPSARTNFQNLEEMIGIPDAVNSSLDDMLRTGVDSSAITANRDGSVMERTEYLIGQVLPSVGLTYKAACDAGMVASTTVIVSDDMIGSGDDYFNTAYSMQIVKNTGTPGAAPEGEIRDITDYVSATGTFTVNAFSGNVEATDEILIIHQSLITGTSPASTIVGTINTNIGDPTGDTLTTITAKLGNPATAIGTVVGTINTNQGDPSGHTLTSTTAKLGDLPVTVSAILGNPTADTLASLSAKFGNGTTAVAPSLGEPDGATTESIHGKLGTDTELADRSMFDLLVGAGPAVYPASAAPGNDVSLAEVLSAVYDDTNTISGGALPAAPTADSLAAFIASGGTALGTNLADSKSIVDALGSDGTTLSYGAGSTLGAVGTEFWVKKAVSANDIDVATALDLTGVSSGGELAIEDVIVKNDATGIATATNINVISNNADGAPIIWAEAVASLGANTTVDLDAASVRGVRTVVEVGKKLQIQATALDATGGTVTVYMKFKRLAAGATIAAA